LHTIAIVVLNLFKSRKCTLIDHALARAEQVLLGILSVEGAPNPEIFNGQVMPGMGH